MRSLVFLRRAFPFPTSGIDLLTPIVLSFSWSGNIKNALLIVVIILGLPMSFYLSRSLSQDRSKDATTSQSRRFNDPPRKTRRSVLGSERKVFESESADIATPVTLEQLELEKLKKELMELMQGHVETLSKKQITETITHLKKMQKEAVAKKKFDKAVALLQEIMTEHPDSNAARQARLMLRHSHQHDSTDPASESSDENSTEAGADTSDDGNDAAEREAGADTTDDGEGGTESEAEISESRGDEG